MLKSMTGFGHVLLTTETFDLIVEVRTLNAKFLDIDLHLPRVFFDKEVEIRNQASEKLQRGKITISVEYHNKRKKNTVLHYNEDVFKVCYNQLKKLADCVQAPHHDIFQLTLQLPSVVYEDTKKLYDSKDWIQIKKYIFKAINKCNQFRKKEGLALKKIMYLCAQEIKTQLIEIGIIEPKRTKKMKDRIKEKMKNHFDKMKFDENKMEQEILFYIEKIAIDEEKNRLQEHLILFNTVLDNPVSSGKKLNFIAQEMGREINTIGSKAQDIDIQKCVITMKEELEKIKEQLTNIL